MLGGGYSMFRKFSFWFALVTVVLSIGHYFGYDRWDMLYLHISIPAWIIEFFIDVHSVNSLIVYGWTILFWFAFGFFLDWAIHRKKAL